MSNGKPQTKPSFERNNNQPNEARKRDYTRRPADPIGWGEVDNQRLRDCIVSVTDANAAILLGRTSDGGALSITVLDGDNRIREWPHTSGEAEAVLTWLVAMFSAD